jgi:hypothetical protein
MTDETEALLDGVAERLTQFYGDPSWGTFARALYARLVKRDEVERPPCNELEKQP